MNKKHVCKFFNAPSDVYGPAIYYCEENDDGELWVDNGEYASRVNYCPYCGYKAPNQFKDEDFIKKETNE